MNLDKRLTRFLHSVRPLFVGGIVLALLRALAVIGQAWYLARILYQVFLNGQGLSDVQGEFFILGGLILLRAVTSWAEQAAAAAVAAQVKAHLRRRLLHALRDHPRQSLLGERSGEIANTLTAGIDALDAYFSQYIPQLLLAVLIPLTILLFVFPVDALSGFVLLLTAPLIPFFMILIGSAARQLTEKQWHALSRLSAHFLDIIRGLTTLKVFNRSRDQVQVIRRITGDFRHATMHVLKVAFLSALVLEMLATLSTAVVAVEIGLRLLYAHISFDQALFVLLLAPEFYLPLRLLGARFHAGMEGVAAADRIFELLGSAPPPPPHARTQLRTPTPPHAPAPPLRFHRVTFRYSPDAPPALDTLSLSLDPGHTLALVGPSGAGKTTAALLLLGFLSPESGRITVGGTPLADLDPADWRRRIAWVPQRPTLFHTTLRENLLLAAPEADDATLHRALERTGLTETVDRLPRGLDTPAGERGARLSGGQVQRLALARAFLQDAPLLVLDEPTAHLDPRYEHHIRAAIADLQRDRTTLLISHRLQTVRDADHILLLSHGRAREAGAHADLLNAGGPYAAMWTAYRGRSA